MPWIEFMFNPIYHANRFTNEVNIPDEQYMLKFQRENKIRFLNK